MTRLSRTMAMYLPTFLVVKSEKNLGAIILECELDVGLVELVEADGGLG